MSSVISEEFRYIKLMHGVWVCKAQHNPEDVLGSQEVQQAGRD